MLTKTNSDRLPWAPQCTSNLHVPDFAVKMSPVALKENLNIRTVAVIGAGPCGLAGAKYASCSPYIYITASPGCPTL